MKRSLSILTLMAALLPFGCSSTSTPPDAVSSRFSFPIAFETGRTESIAGCTIEVRELWGTRPKLEEGGEYLVKGRYAMPAFDEVRVSFDALPKGQEELGPKTDLQRVHVAKGSDAFALVEAVGKSGVFQVTLDAEKEDRVARLGRVFIGNGKLLPRDLGNAATSTYSEPTFLLEFDLEFLDALERSYDENIATGGGSAATKADGMQQGRFFVANRQRIIEDYPETCVVIMGERIFTGRTLMEAVDAAHAVFPGRQYISTNTFEHGGRRRR